MKTYLIDLLAPILGVIAICGLLTGIAEYRNRPKPEKGVNGVLTLEAGSAKLIVLK